MRVAIIGSHGTGKTTLAKALSNHLNKQQINCIIINDIARICPLLVGKNSTKEAQNWIMNYQNEIENIFITNDQIVIFDGCSISHLAYYKYWGGDIYQYEQRIYNSLVYFDEILLLPPNKNYLEDDGLRPIEVEFQNIIHEIIKDILNNYKIKHINYHEDKFDSIINNLCLNKYKLNNSNQKIVVLGIVTNENKILMTLRNDLDFHMANNKWDFPGGTVNMNEHPENAVRREILEETGYLVDIVELIPIINSNTWTSNQRNLHTIVLCYKCKLSLELIYATNTDKAIEKTEWIKINDINSLDLINGIDKFINYNINEF